MTDQHDHVRKVLAYLVTCYPSFQPDSATTAGWAHALKKYTPEELKAAAEHVSRTHTHGAPAAAHLAKWIDEQRANKRIWQDLPCLPEPAPPPWESLAEMFDKKVAEREAGRPLS